MNDYDYYSPSAEKRRQRAIAELNGEKPGISPRLRNIVLISVGIGFIILLGKIFGG